MANKNSRVLATKGNKVTSPFGPRTITYTSGPAKGQTVTSNHNGIDIVGTGSTIDDIVAHTAGTVTSAGYDPACGYYAQIKTASGAVMVYYHMVKGSLKVKTGDKVKQGQILGRMGATGNVTGAHLHFGIKKNGKWINPAPYINADYEKEDKVATKDAVAKTDPASHFERSYAKKYTVTASALHMRRGAGTHKASIKLLPRGTSVTCYGYFSKAPQDNSIWLYVKDAKGDVGFCAKRYLK